MSSFADDILLDAFKFLPRRELCSFTTVSDRFYSLASHPSLPNLLLIDKWIIIVLFKPGGHKKKKQGLFNKSQIHADLREMANLSLLFDGKKGKGNSAAELRSKAKSIIEALEGKVESIELKLVFNAGILFPEINAFFSSLRFHPRFFKITFTQPKNSDRAQFDSKILQFPSIQRCNVIFVEGKFGVYFDIDELQPIIDFLHRPIEMRGSMLDAQSRCLNLRMRELTNRAHNWLRRELEERYIFASQRPNYSLKIELMHLVDSRWINHELDNQTTHEILSFTYWGNSVTAAIEWILD